MPDGANPLRELSRETAAAKALLAAFADILGEDDGARHDAVEGETSLHEAIRLALARVVEIAALQRGIVQAAESLRTRAKRLNEQDDKLRAAMLLAMDVAGVRKLETPIGTVSRRAVSPSVVVTDEALIPDAYWRNPPPVLDKTAIKDALKSGECVPGAAMSNGGSTVSIKLT